MSALVFRAPGIPRPKGSKRMVRTKGGKTVMLEMSGYEKGWRSVVTAAAIEAMAGQFPLSGALFAEFVFEFQRPKKHYTSKGRLRDDAPVYHTGRPDASKLVRSVEDALNGVAIHDDSLLAHITATKLYTEGVPGVRIRIEPLAASTSSGLAAFAASARG